MKQAGLALIGASLALALPGVAQAQESQDTADLEGLLDTSVVSAPSKTSETVSSAPAASVVLTAEDLRRYGIRSLDEAINFLAYGMVTEKAFQNAEIGARGVLMGSDFGSHVLLMVDGHVLNESWSATAYFDRATTIPFELIDHIELVLGPGSVLYGSSAMLGIVHIVTKRAKDYSGVHLMVESEIPVSIRGAAGIGKRFQLFGRAAEVVFQLEHYEQKGPTFDFGPIPHDPDSVTGMARDYDPKPSDRKYQAGVWGGRGNDAYYTRAPSAYLKLRAGDFELAVRGALDKRTDPTNSGNFDDPKSYQLDRWLNVDLKHSVSLSALASLSTRLYADAYSYDEYWTSNGAEDCLDGQVNGCIWRLHGAARTIGLEPQLTLDWLKDGRIVTLLGVDARLKSINSDVTFTDNATGQNPGAIGPYSPHEKALAAYLQQSFSVTSWAALNAGARVDVDDRFGSAISPRAALAVLPWQGGTIKTIYSEAFRAPTAFDIYYNDPSTQAPGGHDLRPEKVRNVEAMIEQRLGRQTFHMGVYRSWWEDLLLLQELSPEDLQANIDKGYLQEGVETGYQVRNVSKIRSFGFDFGFEGALAGGKLHYGANLTEAIARTQNPDGGEQLLNIAAPAFGNARMAYDLPSGLPTVALAVRWVARRPTDLYTPPSDPAPLAQFAPPGVEGRLTLSGAVPGLEGLSYRLTANYNFAKRAAYSTRGSPLADGSYEYSPNDRLRFGAGLQYDFWR
ncbi:MAG TPA: TonB-dependent receptor [Polyangiaceae bacterium]|nr:TonB-dependent receptor [Polyangiaceae bacterium]